MLLFWLQIDASESWQIFWGTVEPLEQLFGPPPWMEGFVVHPKSCRSKKLGYATCFNYHLDARKFWRRLVSTMALNQTTKLTLFCVSTAAKKGVVVAIDFGGGKIIPGCVSKLRNPQMLQFATTMAHFSCVWGSLILRHTHTLEISTFLCFCWHVNGKIKLLASVGICQTRMRRHFNQKRRRLKKKLRFSFVHWWRFPSWTLDTPYRLLFSSK